MWGEFKEEEAQDGSSVEATGPGQWLQDESVSWQKHTSLFKMTYQHVRYVPFLLTLWTIIPVHLQMEEALFLILWAFDHKPLKKQETWVCNNHRRGEVSKYRCICVVHWYITDLCNKESTSNLVQTGNTSRTPSYTCAAGATGQNIQDTRPGQTETKVQRKRRGTKKLRDSVIAFDSLHNLHL